MYRPDAFRNDRVDQLHRVMIDYPFCTLVTHGPDGFNANPMTALKAGTSALAIFNGPNCYVTPSWYPSKHQTRKVVPTWNYVAVHAHGTLEFFDDRDALFDVVTRLTDRHESRWTAPWKVSDAPVDYIHTMLAGIVGIRLLISRLEGKWKISQNRTPEDRAGVIQGLSHSDDPAASVLCALMSKDE